MAMKQTNAASPSAQSARARAFCSLALALPLAAGPLLSGCDSMQSRTVGKERPAIVPEREAPAQDISSSILATLKGNSSMEKKMEAMQDFAEMYPMGEYSHWAASTLSLWAEREFGSDFSNGPNELKSDKGRVEFAYSLAYGLSLFGREGLGEAIKLVAKMDNGRKRDGPPGKERFSLSMFVSLHAVDYFNDSGNLSQSDKDAAVRYISTFLTKPYVSADTKVALITLARRIDSSALTRLRDNKKIDVVTQQVISRMIMEERTGNLGRALGKQE